MPNDMSKDLFITLQIEVLELFKATDLFKQ